MLRDSVRSLLKELASFAPPSKPAHLIPQSTVASEDEAETPETSQTPEEMKCLVDKLGEKLARRLFQVYVSDQDMRRWPSFMMALDQLLSDFGGQAPSEEKEKEAEAEEQSSTDSDSEDAGEDEEFDSDEASFLKEHDLAVI